MQYQLCKPLITKKIQVVSNSHSHVFYAVFVPLEHIPSIPPHSTYVIVICTYHRVTFRREKELVNNCDMICILATNKQLVKHCDITHKKAFFPGAHFYNGISAVSYGLYVILLVLNKIPPKEMLLSFSIETFLTNYDVMCGKLNTSYYSPLYKNE